MENNKNENLFLLKDDNDGFNALVKCLNVGELKSLFFKFATDHKISLENRIALSLSIMEALSLGLQHTNNQNGGLKYVNEYINSKNTNLTNNVSYDN